MPTLPTYNSKQNIQANTAEPLRNEAAQPFKDDQKVLGAMQDATQKWSDANDVMQYTEAKAKHGLAIADIESRASLDPDFKNSDKYTKELQNASKNSLTGISNQQVAGKAGLEFNYDNQIAQIKIDHIQKKKQIDYTKGVTVPQDINNYQNKMIASQTEAEFMVNKQGMLDTIDRNVAIGVYSYEEGDKLKKKSELDAARNAVYTDTSKARQQLNDGYYNITPSEKGKLISESNSLDYRRLKEQTELQKQIQYTTESNIALDIANNKTPSVQMLADAVQAGTISSDFASTIMKTVTSPAAVAAQTNNEEFSNLTQEIFKSKDKQGVQKAIVNILKGGGDGKLSKEDLGVLVNSAMLQGQNQRKDIDNAITTLGNWADQSKLNRADVFRTFQNSIKEGKSVAEASDASMKKTIVDTIPGASNLEDVPNAVIDKDSKVRYIFPKTTNISAHRIYQQDKKGK